MALNTLCTAFRRIAIDRGGKVPVRGYFKGQVVSDKNSNFFTSLSVQANDGICKTNFNVNIKFAPRTLNMDFELPMNSSIHHNIVDIPITRISIIENPNKYIPIRYDIPLPNKSIELPTNGNIIEKQAVRMIVIRRKKMKKHQR
ncbi:hypothetical protein KPH14_003387 [Odynerus spinipes]|uniref:Uncharacterized protein n=1 Tax=Odynerus spinipes TaxID=1348599 RepID=A0AAD9RCI5_9HYME|nr:hypothetical protein KPH14_003387 [Odynerus spinipes]